MKGTNARSGRFPNLSIRKTTMEKGDQTKGGILVVAHVFQAAEELVELIGPTIQRYFD